MKHSHDILRDRLLLGAGLVDPSAPLKLAELEKTEWSPAFERLMRNRLIIGSLRYGRMAANKGKPYDRVGSAKKRLDQYLTTGNTELLVDAANLCLCEFECGNHPAKHFCASDDGEHVQLKP